MINHIFKPKGSRIWRWKFRLVPADGKILDVSLGTSDRQSAETKRSDLLREKEHERAGLIPSKAAREAAQCKLTQHLQDFLGDLRIKGRNGRYINGVAYNDAEMAALLSVAGAQSIVYQNAYPTGSCHGEMKELCWGDFNLSVEKPTVTVRASVSKNHRQACLPLHPELAAALVQFRPSKVSAGDLLFKGLVPRSKLLNSHLKAANIAKKDSQGRVVDFHSLRHTLCTNLQRAGVPQREIMELMRHNDPRLTATTYTDTSLLSLGTAVQKIGLFPSPIASSFLGAEGHSVTQPVANTGGVQSVTW